MSWSFPPCRMSAIQSCRWCSTEHETERRAQSLQYRISIIATQYTYILRLHRNHLIFLIVEPKLTKENKASLKLPNNYRVNPRSVSNSILALGVIRLSDCSPWLPWCNDTIILTTYQYQLLDLEKICPVLYSWMKNFKLCATSSKYKLCHWGCFFFLHHTCTHTHTHTHDTSTYIHTHTYHYWLMDHWAVLEKCSPFQTLQHDEDLHRTTQQ